jgi:uncharacterized protein with PIN domain
MCPAEDYRAKATEYERLTRVTRSLREGGKYREQAQVYRALALGEEPEISPATRTGANRCPNCDAPITAPLESKYLPGQLVEHHWRCQTCDVSWKSRFDPMLA